jgi:hypothetical protein
VDTGGLTPRRDPEFDSTAVPGILTPLDSPEYYLRLIANPFLAILAFLAWLGALVWLCHLDLDRELIGPMVPIIAVVFLFGLWKIGSLFQYHCLDCGKTGRMSRWREHVCVPSALRRQAGRVRRFRGPSLFVQVVLWLWGLLALGLVVRSAGLLRF